MKTLVAAGAQLSCDQGAAPCSLVVAPLSLGEAAELPLATVDHHQAMHIVGFGMCRLASNPAVAAATAAAQGVLTPAPCVPLLQAPWSNTANDCSLDGTPLLASDAELSCAYGGTVSVVDSKSAVTIR